MYQICICDDEQEVLLQLSEKIKRALELLDIILVFVTSHDALVYRTFAYKPFAFLRKTCLDEDLAEFSQRIGKELEQKKSELILTKGTELCKVRIKDIVYMESEGNYINIVTTDHTGICENLQVIPSAFITS